MGALRAFAKGAARAGARALPRLAFRLSAAALIVTAAAWTWSVSHETKESGPSFPIGQDVERVIAAARATRVPRSAAEELQAIDRRIAFQLRRATTGPRDWMAWESLARLHLARAQITGDYRSFAEAEAALGRAFAIAPPGSGPHLARAELNLAVHRISRVGADLAAVRGYPLPGEASPAGLLAMEGDTAFYSGRFAEALRDYEAVHEAGRSLASGIKLAQYWSRMGNEAKTARYLDEAEAAIYGAQPAARSFVERIRGTEALRRGEWSEAKRHFVAAHRLFPGSWPNLFYLAVAAALGGDRDRALALFEGLGRTGRIPEAMDAAASLHQLNGHRAEAAAWAARAEAVWQERMRLFPEAAAHHRLDHLLAFGDPVEALAVARRAYAARPYPDSRIGVAWALIANERAREALAVLAPVRRSGWQSPEYHLAAARALERLGRGGEAKAEQAAAERLNPKLADRSLPPFMVEH